MIIEQSVSDYSLAGNLLNNFMIVFKNSKLLDFFVNEADIFANRILEHIEHNDDKDYIYENSVYDILKNYFVGKYKFNSIQMEVLRNKFGNRLIRFLENDNIKNLINSSSSKFNRFIELFPDVEFTIQDIEMIYDSLKQYEFTKVNTEIMSIFTDIKHSLEDNTDEYIKLINKIIPVLDNHFSIKFKEYYPEFANGYKSGKQLVTEVINNLTRENNVEKNLELLHFITDYYIAINREAYRDNYNMEAELKLPYMFDEKDSFNKLVRCPINQNLINTIEKIFKEKYNLDKQLGNMEIVGPIIVILM